MVQFVAPIDFNRPIILVRSNIKMSRQVIKLISATIPITTNTTLRFTSCMSSQSKIFGYTSLMLLLIHSEGKALESVLLTALIFWY